MTDRIVLYSGGPDSYITHFEVDRQFGNDERVLPVYFSLGHRYEMFELDAIRRTIPETSVLEALSGLGQWEEHDANIYQRNAFLALAASKLSESSVIYLSVQKDELEAPDRSPEFLASMNELFLSLKVEAKVESLWLYRDKPDMFEHYKNHGGRIEDLTNTWSCYTPALMETPKERAVVHCGNCPACIRRCIAFLSAFEQDMTIYNESPAESEMARKYFMWAEEGKYSEDRKKRIMDFLA